MVISSGGGSAMRVLGLAGDALQAYYYTTPLVLPPVPLHASPLAAAFSTTTPRRTRQSFVSQIRDPPVFHAADEFATAKPRVEIFTASVALLAALH